LISLKRGSSIIGKNRIQAVRREPPQKFNVIHFASTFINVRKRKQIFCLNHNIRNLSRNLPTNFRFNFTSFNEGENTGQMEKGDTFYFSWFRMETDPIIPFPADP
jgi:hypothetical protein